MPPSGRFPERQSRRRAVRAARCGIFGGKAGAHVLALLRELRMPIVTTLHTVLSAPNPAQRAVIE